MMLMLMVQQCHPSRVPVWLPNGADLNTVGVGSSRPSLLGALLNMNLCLQWGHRALVAAFEGCSSGVVHLYAEANTRAILFDWDRWAAWELYNRLCCVFVCKIFLL